MLGQGNLETLSASKATLSLQVNTDANHYRAGDNSPVGDCTLCLPSALPDI